jgi:hypothetical protein
VEEEGTAGLAGKVEEEGKVVVGKEGTAEMARLCR